jgi:hypothetical protein
MEEIKAMPNPWEAVLTPVEYENLQGYSTQLGLTPDHVLQLNQSWCKHPMYSRTTHTLHTVIKNCGIMWCRGKIIAPEELALYQGLPVRSWMSDPRHALADISNRRYRACSFCPPLPNAPEHERENYHRTASRRGRTAMVGQIGNGMNLSVCGSVLLGTKIS